MKSSRRRLIGFFFALFLLIGLHHGIRYLAYRTIQSRVGPGVPFSSVGIGYFPLSVTLKEIQDIKIPGLTTLSCEKLIVSMPVWALLTDRKPVDVVAVNPKLKLDDHLVEGLESRSSPSSDSSFYLRRLKVEAGLMRWFDKSSGLEASADSFSVESATQLQGGALKVTIPHARLFLPVSGRKIRLLGQLKLEIKHMTDTLSIRNLEWQGKELNLFGSGRYFISDGTFVFRSSLQLQTQTFLEPIIEEFAPESSAYGDLMVSKGADGLISAQANLRAARFSVRGQLFEALNGSVKWDSLSQEIQAFTVFEDQGLSSAVDVLSKPGGVEVFIRNISAKKVSIALDIADTAPLSSVVSSAQFSIKGVQIGGSAVLEREKETGKGFNLSGPLDFLYDTKTKETRFSCKQGLSELGPFSIYGLIQPDQPLSLQIDVTVNVNNLQLADLYSRHFIDLDLERWQLSGGAGRLDVSVSERGGRMETSSSFILEEFASSGVPLSRFSGTVRSRGRRAEGNMEIRDGALQADVDFLNTPAETLIHFNNAFGQTAIVMKLLGLELDLQGEGRGDFEYRMKSGSRMLPVITGRFSTGKIYLSGFPFDSVTGRIWSDTQQIRLDDLNYIFYGGTGETDLFIDYFKRVYRISGTVRGLDCSSMHPEFSGLGDCRFSGEGEFFVDPIQVDLRFPDMAFYPDRPFSFEIEDGKVLTDFETFKLSLLGKGRRQEIDMPLELELESKDGRYSGTFTAAIRDLNMLIPWKDNQGDLNLNVRIGSGTQGNLDFQGVANFKGQRLTFPGFAHTIDDFEGFITINNGQFTLQSFQGQLGGGPVEGNGFLSFSGDRIRDMNLTIRGQGMTLYPMDRMKCTIDTELNLKQMGERFMLSGQIMFLDTLWEREMMENLSFNTDADFSSAESAFLDLLDYDLKLQNKGEVNLRNSLMEARGSFNLHLVGSFDRPLITGVLEGRSGTVSFGDKKFAVSKAKVLFNNPFIMDPVIQLDSETFIQNYRIRFTISGALSRLNPQITSSPPLPQQDILALMSQGELFKRPTTTELSSRMGTAGLISGVLLEDVQKRAKALFGIDILRFEPDTERSLGEGGSRVTIGTSISRNMIIVYSTNMSTSRREVMYVHYQLSPTVSLVGMRNEEGNFSIDIRFRKRY